MPYIHCYRDAQGRRNCDHIHAEDLEVNGGGYHDEEFSYVREIPGWTVQNSGWPICPACDEICPPELYYGHVSDHYVNG